MPRPSQKSKIIDAALSCFAQFGYEGTRIHHIAERAGVSEGALYKHYPSKEAIAQELHAHYFSLIANHIQQISITDLPADQKLRQIGQAMLDDYRSHTDAFNFVLLRLPAFIIELPAGAVYPMDIVEGVIRAGQAAGLIRAGQPNLLAAIFFGCVVYPIIFANTSDPGSIDLIHDTFHDATILESAWTAVARQAS
ncbi:MAG: TetR/AcrR family transcriptional regulator [Chloroflexi bacterium]|nr:TetR/AcrR family transcriptional regulator [Chloroflexota bacterium]